MKAKQAHLRILSLLLCLSMIIGMAPMVQLFAPAAATNTDPALGTCTNHGTEVEWTDLITLATKGADDKYYLNTNQTKTHHNGTSGDYSYTSLPAGHYYLSEDLYLNGTLDIGGDVHLDLRGNDIHAVSGKPYYVYINSSNVYTALIHMRSNSKKLTLCDSVGGGTIDGTNFDPAARLVYVDGGIFNMYGGKITGAKNGAVQVTWTSASNRGQFNMYGGAISGNAGGNYGSVLYLVNGSTVNILGGTISGNTNTTSYGAIRINAGTVADGKNSTLNISGGTITGNTSGNGGAVINSNAHGTINISGKAVVDEGAIKSDGDILISGLTEGASVYTKTQGTMSDDTAQEATEGDLYHYTYKSSTPTPPPSAEPTEISGEVAALTPGNYVLKGDVTLTAALTLTAGEYTIDLNGRTLIGEAAPYFTIPEQCTLTIKDSGGTGSIKSELKSSATSLIVVNGTLILESGKITGHDTTTNGGALTVAGTAIMRGGEISGHYAKSGGAVYVTGSFTMEGGKINGNKAGNGGGGYGGAVFPNAGSTLIVNGGEITNNTAVYGGAIGTSKLADITVNDGTISGNEATNNGVVMYCGRSTINIKGGTFTGNVGSAEGKYTLYLTGCNTEITGGTISGNVVKNTTNPINAILSEDNKSSSTDGKVDISGTPVIGDLGIKIVSGSEVILHNFEQGASVLGLDDLTIQEGDITVLKNDKLYTYNPDSAGDPDSPVKDWVLFTEDFSDYPVGDDAIWDSANDESGAAYPWWQVNGSYHGKPTDASYAQYGIIEDNGNKFFDLKSVNETTARIITKTGVSGPYTVKLDFFFPSGTNTKPQFCVTLFQGSTLGGDVMVYVTPGEDAGARIRNTKNSSYIMNGDKNLILGYDTWYTMEYGFEEGKATLSIWEKTAGENTKLSVTRDDLSEITKTIVNNANTVRLQSTGKKDQTNSVYIDNLSITKAVALSMKEFVAAAPGDVMDTVPAGDAAIQQPTPKYQYTLTDPTFGTVNDKGQLVAGNAEGETSLKLTLLDVRGNVTDISYDTIFVVGDNNGVSIGEDIRVPETDIGKTNQLTPNVENDVAAAYPNYKLSWSSSNEGVATVDQSGLVTYKGYGSAKITAMLLDAEGNQTRYFASLNIQVGEKALKILSIGNSFSRDSLYYISQLAFAAGKRVEAAYLMRSSADLQDHAYNLAHNVADYSWYVSNAYNGEMLYVSGDVTIQEKVESQDWDVIILHQGVNSVGNRSTFNADLEYLVDYLEDVQPNAKLYWNMTWALQDGFASGNHGKDFGTYYGADQKVMYNAIVSVLDEFIVGNDAQYSSTNPNNLGGKLGWGFDGYFANGVAIQSLRETIDHDLDLTRDGFHLSLDIGRLTTSLTILKTLYPDLDLSVFTESVIGDIIITDKNDYNGTGGTVMDEDESTYTYTAADLPKIIQAVTNAVAISKSGVPAKLTVKKPVNPADVNSQANSSIQVEAPMNLHFPDIKVLADGTLIAGYYENLDHVPLMAKEVATPYDAMAEGAGRLVIFESRDGGKTWNNTAPILVVDQFQMEKWGISEAYGRYDRIGAGTSQAYTSFTDPRDPNLGTAFVDFNNDGTNEEVVLFTFWVRNYDATGAQSIGGSLWLLTGVRNDDGTYTWVEKPVQITGAGVKRGDITSFADGEILVPTYNGGNKVYAVSMSWDSAAKTWIQNEIRAIPNLDTEEDTTFSETSLITPDPNGDIVFAFCRQNGIVLKSSDRGKNWELIGNEPGRIHQPGFVKLDDNRIFVTWAVASYPRDIYGKVFYFNADWSDTQSRLIYGSLNRDKSNDTGDPSCTINSDGNIVVLSYDVNYRAIIVSILDPNDPKWLPIEMTDDIDDVIIYESETDAALGTTNVIPETVKPNGAYTVSATVTFASKDGTVTIATASGSVTIPAGDLALNTPTNIIVKSVGNQNYVKVWQGNTEPAGYTVYADKGTAAEQPNVTGSGAVMTDVKVTVKFLVELQETLEATKGAPAIQLEYMVQPESAGFVFASSDERVVKVSPTGLVTIEDEGTATITMTVGNAVVVKCEVKVKSEPAELTGRGETSNIVIDDFEEDKYTAGENALWNDYWDDKANSFYNFENKAGMNKDSFGETRYNIIKDSDGNQYLELKGRTTWFMNKQPITGNYTTQFDIMFSGTGRSLNLTPWQNDLLVETNQIHGFINLQANKYRFQFRPYDLWEYPSTTATDDQPTPNPNMYCIGNNNQSTTGGWDVSIGKAGIWQTIKITRVDGGLYLKIWERGTEEPAGWTCVLTHAVLDTDMDSHFRFQFDCGTTGQSVYIDNLSITQQIVDSYTVNFVNGDTTTPQKVEEGTKVFAPRTPIKTGYTFVGWYNGETAYDFNTPVTGNLTLTAKWSINKYTVSFDSGVASQTVEYGSKATKPADPTKEGYVFGGWYLNDTAYDFNAPVSGSISLTAKWLEKVTIPVSGEDNTIHVDVTVEDNVVTIQPIDPDELDKVVGKDVETGDVVVDLTELDKDVESVVLPLEAVQQILDAAKESGNDTEALVIKLPEVIVELDDKTMHVITDTVEGDVALSVNLIEVEDLNTDQKQALKDKKTFGGIDISLVCTATGEKVTDFEGGKVTMKVPFEVPANHKANGFSVWYVAEDGKLTKMTTKYEDGHLVFSTGHFSDYIIIYEEPAPEGNQPGGSGSGSTGNDGPSKTGDTAMPAAFILLATMSITALTVIALGKKKFF